jgi:Cu-Zn family superoxide dismutase
MFFSANNHDMFINKIGKGKPGAVAKIKGSDKYPKVNGTASFYPTFGGTLVVAEVFGLPTEKEKCSNGIFAFHIHEGTQCTGNANDPFAAAGGHYNPEGCEHPHHAGDLPPLFGNNGYAWSCVFTDRFSVNDVMGRTVIIHRNVDDFTTQPAGNAGEKIACGVIMKE